MSCKAEGSPGNFKHFAFAVEQAGELYASYNFALAAEHEGQNPSEYVPGKHDFPGTVFSWNL